MGVQLKHDCKKGRLKKRETGFSDDCGGLLVFAQIISDIKKRRNLGKTWISAFFAFEKSCISFFTKPRGNARFFVESCRVLIGF